MSAAVWQGNLAWLDQYLSKHQAGSVPDHCACLRPVPCPVVQRWEPYRRECLDMLAGIEASRAVLTGPTWVLPIASWP